MNIPTAHIITGSRSFRAGLGILIMLCILPMRATSVRAEEVNDDFHCFGDSVATVDSISLRVYFRQDVSRLEPTYRNNDLQLDAFVRKIQSALVDSSYCIQDISIYAGASPEGGYNHNMDLSINRAEAIRDYLMASLDLQATVFRLHPIGEDWDGLRNLVVKYNPPYSSEVLHIIDSIPLFTYDRQGTLIDSRKKHLMDLRGGRAWNYLLNQIYPELRSGNNRVICHIRKVQPQQVVNYVTEYMPAPIIAGGKGLTPEQEALLHKLDSLGLYPQDAGAGKGGCLSPEQEAMLNRLDSLSRDSAREARRERARNYQFALKSNLLYDAVGAVNLEVEFPIGKYVSVLAEYVNPWYVSKDNHRCYQLQTADLEVRGWLSNIKKERARLEGWFVGVYYGIGKYDFEWNATGVQGEFWVNAGLSAGYSWKIAENWRVEASLCLGFMKTNNRYYDYNDDVDLLIWQKTEDHNWYGPTKLKVSVGWMLPMHKTKKPAETLEEKGGEL